MRKTLLALALMMLLSAGAAQAQYIRAYGYCEDGNQTVTTAGIVSTTVVQRSYPGCTINVYAPGTTNPATIYSDSVGTPKANPFTGSATGFWFFYGATGCYDVQLSGGGITAPFTLGDVCLASLEDGNNTFNGNLIFNGTATFNNLVTFNGPVTMASSLDVAASLSVGGDLDLAMGTHIQWPNAFLYQGDEAHGQLMGIGDGTTVMFTGTVRHRPILPNSVDVLVNDVVVGSDDGAGNLSGGTIAAGSINYTTGAFTVTFTAAPADLIQVEITDVVEDNLILGTNSGTPQNAFVVIQNDLKISGPAPGRGLGALFAQVEFLSLVSGGGTPATAPFVGAVQVYEKATDALGAKVIYYRDHALNEYQLCSVELANCSGGGGGGVTAVTATSPIVSSGGFTPNISCPTCLTTAPTAAGALIGGDFEGSAATAFRVPFGNGGGAGATQLLPLPVGAWVKDLSVYISGAMGTSSRKQVYDLTFASSAPTAVVPNGGFILKSGDAADGYSNFERNQVRVEELYYWNTSVNGTGGNNAAAQGWTAVWLGDDGGGIIGASIPTTAILAGATNYAAPFDSIEIFAAEVQAQWPAPVAGTLGRLTVQVSNNQTAAATCVMTVRVDGAPSALTLTLPMSGNAGYYFDWTHTVHVTEGQKIAFERVEGGGAAGCQVSAWAVTYVPDDPTEFWIGGHVANGPAGTITTNDVPAFWLPFTRGTASTTEVLETSAIAQDGTISGCRFIQLVVTPNPSTVSADIRVGGASVISGTWDGQDAAGTVESIAGTSAINKSDTFSLMLTGTSGAGANMGAAGWSCKFTLP